MSTTAIVGCGHIHTPDFIKLINERGDVRVKSVWDHQRNRAEKRAAEVNAHVVDDLSDIWNDGEIESVIILSETNRHEQLVLSAVQANKHLFVEKPLGITARDAQQMADAINAADVIFQTGYFHRGFATNRFLYEHIQKGSFGTITRIRHSNCHAGLFKGWFDDEWRWMADTTQAGVGAFGDLGTHSLDLLMWLMGDVERVTADINTVVGRFEDCDEYGEGMLRFANGATGTLAAGWVDIANPVTLVLSGTEGHAHIVNRNELYIQSKHIEGADGQQPWVDLPNNLQHPLLTFFDAIHGQANLPLVTPQEAASRSAVMEALYEGARTQRWIDIS